MSTAFPTPSPNNNITPTIDTLLAQGLVDRKTAVDCLVAEAQTNSDVRRFLFTVMAIERRRCTKEVTEGTSEAAGTGPRSSGGSGVEGAVDLWLRMGQQPAVEPHDGSQSMSNFLRRQEDSARVKESFF